MVRIFFSKEIKKKILSSELNHKYLDINDYIKYLMIIIIFLLAPEKMKSNYVRLKIYGIGAQNILKPDLRVCPDQIYLNDATLISINQDNCRIIFINNAPTMENYITLIFNYKFTSLGLMFMGLLNLLEADLSHLDFTGVKYTDYMFYGCEKLTSVNLNNINTPALISMTLMFYDCFSLRQLDLSFFDTSKVSNMKALFHRCKALRTINIENFKTAEVLDMSYMFITCMSLTNLNLRNFDTSKVKDMSYMFYNCNNLVSLNLSSFDASSVTNFNYMFAHDINLLSLNLKNFKTLNVISMDYMFVNCNKINYLDLSNFITPNLEKMEALFGGCENLMYIDMPFFDISKVENMNFLFYECFSLISVNLNNFNTNKVKTMESMFYNCQSLTFLNLSNFYTPQLQSIALMFYNCISLEYLDISNLITNNVYNMEYTFYNCKNLKSLNLSNFITSKVIYMNGTFENCLSLTSLDISYFDTSSVKFIDFMFSGCKFLGYINFILYHESINLELINDILLNTPDNIVMCINENNNVDKLKEEINKKICPTIYCGDDWKIHQKILKDNNSCFELTQSTFIINPQTTSDISKEVLINISESLIITNSFTSELIINTTNIETSIINNIDIINTTIIEPIKVESEIKISEYPEITDIKINTTDISTFLNIPTSEIINKLDVETSNLELSTNFETDSFKIITSQYYDDSNSTSEEIKKRIYEQIINNIIQNLETLNETEIILEGKDNFYYQLTTLENELNSKSKNNSTKRFSRIDLGECENALRHKYNLNENVSFLILKYEKITNISSERNLQYEIYESVNKTRLNLSVCKDIPINVYVPVVLSENLQNLFNELKELGYDLFDINSVFYQDICTPYKSSNGTDVLLSDRVNYYFNNDETQCQSNCQFSDYSMETQDLKCECDVESSEINIEKKQGIGSKSIYKSFYDVLKFSNYKVLKCYKLAFSSTIFKNNKGNILALVYFCIYLIFLLIYFIRGKNELKNDLFKLILDDKINLANRASINNKNNNNNIFNINNKKNNNNIFEVIHTIKNKNDNSKKDNNKRLILRKDLKKRKLDPRIKFNYPPKKRSNIIKVIDDKFINSDKDFSNESKFIIKINN